MSTSKKEQITTWIGSWKNQYGSELTIESEANGHINGHFKSAVDNNFNGDAIIGICRNELIVFTIDSKTESRKVAAWTGMLHDGRIETLWHVAGNEKLTADAEGSPGKKKHLGVWEAFMTGADIFERIK
jgi:avidin family protein